MTIVDADALAQLILHGPRHEQARKAFLEDSEWAAPPLWHSDFRGMLAKRINAGELSVEAALRAYEAARLVIAGNEPEPDTRIVLELIGGGVDSYDAEYIAAARGLGVPFFSTDPELSSFSAGNSTTSEVVAR